MKLIRFIQNKPVDRNNSKNVLLNELELNMHKSK